MTAISSPLQVYTRRVSFNNLDTCENTDAGNAWGSYNHLNSIENPSSVSKDLDVSKFFGNYTMNGGPTLTPTFRKRLRLPEPPSKLILKNKLTPTQLQLNIANAINSGIELSPTALTFNPDNDPEHGNDPSDDSLSSELEDEMPAPTTRRKLFAGMSDEELMALDPQFAKPSTSNLDRFKFDSVTTYYSPVRRRSSTGNAVTTAQAAKGIAYPSLNENNYKCISLTLKHQDYDHEDTGNRTLLTVISGRKHTWNSLDWLLSNELDQDKSSGILKNGDYLVVAALVPFKYSETESKNGLKKKSVDEILYKKCDLILQYILKSLPEASLKLRITVELVMDVPPSTQNGNLGTSGFKSGTKMMISHLYKQYNPFLVILGNRLTNLNFKYPIRLKGSISGPSGQKGSVLSGKNERETAEFLIKLSSYVVKYSMVPVIFVGNATKFHQKIERKQSQCVTFFGSLQLPRSILDVPQVNYRKNSAVSDNSIESFTGGASSNDLRSDESGFDIHTEVNELFHSTAEDRFASMLLVISQSSLVDSQHYISLINDTSIERLGRDITSGRVHQAYISGNQGKNGSLLLKTSSGTSTGAYRVKSLILYSEEEEKKNGRMINEKKLRKSASRSSMGSLPIYKVEEKKDKKEKGEKKEKRSFFLKLGFKKS